jgi:hypothetical protein
MGNSLFRSRLPNHQQCLRGARKTLEEVRARHYRTTQETRVRMQVFDQWMSTHCLLLLMNVRSPWGSKGSGHGTQHQRQSAHCAEAWFCMWLRSGEQYETATWAHFTGTLGPRYTATPEKGFVAGPERLRRYCGCHGDPLRDGHRVHFSAS